jgi:dTDP-4-amino-4,6-dideoxygalactose transaminase
MNILFGDLKRQYASIKPEIDSAVAETLAGGWYVLGEGVRSFEKAFAEYCGARSAVGVGSGTEALHLALSAFGVGSGDEVVTVANTCVPTVSAISVTGARIVLTDVDPTSCTMEYHDLERKVTPRTKAIIPVHLYGQSADLDPIHAIARKRGIPVIEDAAQAHGSEYNGRRIGSLSDLTCFSFYPSKNLGAFGDGGAVTANDEGLVQRLRMLRNYGEEKRYHHVIRGFNSRLDELQASVLRVKLAHLDAWNARRREIAEAYRTLIRNPLVSHPEEKTYGKHNYHLYVVRVCRRDDFQAYLASRGIGTFIHYPIPVHLQEAYADLGYAAGEFPVTELLAQQIVSLPMYPELTADEIRYVAETVNSFN